jgi:hypothetical protein
MTNFKKIEYASVDITTPCLIVIDGMIRFDVTTEDHVLENFFVPETIETEKQLDHYLSQLLYNSDCDTSYVRGVYVHEWN